MTPIETELLKFMVSPPVMNGGALEATFVLGRDFQGFRGHFPGDPLCPGVVQIRSALLVMEQFHGVKYRLSGVENAKFMRPLRPGEAFTVSVEPPTPGGKVNAALTCEGSGVAKFRVLVEEAT